MSAVSPPFEEKVPRSLLIGAGILAISTLLLASLARISGYRPEQVPASAMVESIALRFEDQPNGAVKVYSSPAGQLFYTIAPGTDGFVRGVLRGLVRARHAYHLGQTEPFRLTRWADGRLSLDDPSTGRHVDLEVFGLTNAGAFADILMASNRPKDQP